MNDETENEPVRLPGLYRAWEVGQLLRAGQTYRVEEAATTADGTPVYAVFARDADVQDAGMLP